MVAGSSSPCRWLSEIVGGDLPSLLSFRSAGGGTWAVAACRGWLNKAYSLQSMIRTIGPDRIEHCPGMIFESAVCPLGGTRIEVRATCPLGGTDRVDSDSCACHVSSGVPTVVFFATRPMQPAPMKAVPHSNMLPFASPLSAARALQKKLHHLAKANGSKRMVWGRFFIFYFLLF